jgi:membrane protein implicated in regulation of membrane protease activity
MTMSPALMWWIAAGLLVLAELATGTFYLLMLSLGLAGAALAAHAGLGTSAQLVTAALVGGGAVVAWRLRRQREAAPPPVSSNRDIHLDVGESVQVTVWEIGGRTRVNYRGAQWQARWEGPGAPEPGRHVIRALDGNELVLGR